MKATLPNFFVIGVAKAGTTSLDRYLSEHPEIFMCPHKEPRYYDLKDKSTAAVKGPKGQLLAENGVIEFDAYQALFQQAGGYKVVGDNSPRYMESDVAAANIFEAAPDAKLLAILRDPVDRSYSHFKLHLRARVEHLSEVTSNGHLDVAKIVERLSDPFYVNTGQYYRQLEHFLQYFYRNQLKIVFFEDLENAPEALMCDIFSFLGVDPEFSPGTHRKYNIGGVPRSNVVQYLIKEPNIFKELTRTLLPNTIYDVLKSKLSEKNNQGSAPTLPPGARRKLQDHYREDIRKLENLIGRDLPHWRS